MLRVYEIQNDERREILNEGGVYNVQELGLYELRYFSDDVSNLPITIEGGAVPAEYVRLEKNRLTLVSHRYFEDYFGGTLLTIGEKEYPFNVRISKLKRAEIEGLFTYLWEKEDRLFDTFAKDNHIQLQNKPNEVGQVGGLLSLLKHFVAVFQQLFPYFEKQPHFVLRKKTAVIPFDSTKVSSNTVQWIVHNLDEVQFDNSFKGHYKAIKLNDHYGMIDTIHTEVESQDFNTYENQVVLGSFFAVLKKLRYLRRDIEMKLSQTALEATHERYVDFKDLTHLPFIRLLSEIGHIEQQLKKLEQRYLHLFEGVTPRPERPVLTSIFIQRPHYKKAYKLIRQLSNYKFELQNYFTLFNISKLSKLYELYNLFQLMDILKSSLNLSLFELTVVYREDEPIAERIQFETPDISVNLYYDHAYYPEGTHYFETSLRRIDKIGTESYYQPDFILEIINREKETVKYYLFDAKYSSLKNVKNIHLPSLEKKYIVRTGISGQPSQKINGLYALFPDDEGENLIPNSFFEPQISLIASKPQRNSELRNCVQKVLQQHLAPSLLVKEM